MRLIEFKDLIAGDSYVETITENQLADGKQANLQGTWDQYKKTLTPEEWMKEVRLLPQYGIRLVFNK